MRKKTPESSFRQLLDRLGKPDARGTHGGGEALSVRLVYNRFRELLALNETLHKLIADVEEKLQGRSAFQLEPMAQRIRQGFIDTFMMVKDLNQIAEDRYSELYIVLHDLSDAFEAELSRREFAAARSLVMPLSRLHAADAMLAGVKMANLGEVSNRVSLPVPDGFAITTAAFNLFMTQNDLWDKVHQLTRTLGSYGPGAIEKAGRELREAILGSPVPQQVAQAIYQAFDILSREAPIPVAMRSSAVGEDLASSHAGQYYTELQVSRAGLLDAYRMVLASAYNSNAVAYRYTRGLAETEAIMAVGCQKMIQPRCAGILFSRDFRDLDADRVELSLAEGLADKVVGGERKARQLIISRDDFGKQTQDLLSVSELQQLYRMARQLEAHFGCPQDIEWAIALDGNPYVLQTRQMMKAKETAKLIPAAGAAGRLLLEGGHMACPGAGSGPVVIVHGATELSTFPDGAVAVAKHASPAYSRIMTRASAIITEIGSPIGHMAILAREFNLPAIVGLAGVTRTLPPGKMVTVDAGLCLVYEGVLEIEHIEQKPDISVADPYSMGVLRRISRLVTPLHLIEPSAPEFTPHGCCSLHDLTRFVHEKLYETMFKFGDRASRRLKNYFQLEADLPIDIRVFDVGGGIVRGAGTQNRIGPDEILSAPLKTMLSGMQDPRIDWKKPRRISAKGFFSVLGENMLGPPPDMDVDSISFVVVSDLYLNFSIKAGYHFSTIDAFCAPNENQNYINFRFAGGGASHERRSRRLRFISEILSSMDFVIQTRADLLIARLEKAKPELVLARLCDLGRLTLCSRQLDMLMDSDSSPDYYAQAFIKQDFDKF